MSWRVKGIQLTGKCHEENLPMGQDRICYTSKNGIAVIGVADGCSESKASDIIKYREENGGFSTLEELMKIPGIKEGVYNKLSDKIALD